MARGAKANDAPDLGIMKASGQEKRVPSVDVRLYDISAEIGGKRRVQGNGFSGV
jgi:hypothetical protein